MFASKDLFFEEDGPADIVQDGVLFPFESDLVQGHQLKYVSCVWFTPTCYSETSRKVS